MVKKKKKSQFKIWLETSKKFRTALKACIVNLQCLGSAQVYGERVLLKKLTSLQQRTAQRSMMTLQNQKLEIFNKTTGLKHFSTICLKSKDIFGPRLPYFLNLKFHQGIGNKLAKKGDIYNVILEITQHKVHNFHKSKSRETYNRTISQNKIKKTIHYLSIKQTIHMYYLKKII